ncbi:hypothetical protein ABZP36_016943 [Zizania latifolia]
MLGNCPLIAVVLAGAIAQFIKVFTTCVEIDRIKKENDNMQIELRHLKGEDINSLQPKELIMIEEALDNGLTNVHEKLMDDWEWLVRNYFAGAFREVKTYHRGKSKNTIHLIKRVRETHHVVKYFWSSSRLALMGDDRSNGDQSNSRSTAIAGAGEVDGRQAAESVLCCDRSNYQSNVCYVHSDMRVDPPTSSVLIYNASRGSTLEKVWPCTRKTVVALLPMTRMTGREQ